MNGDDKTGKEDEPSGHRCVPCHLCNRHLRMPKKDKDDKEFPLTYIYCPGLTGSCEDRAMHIVVTLMTVMNIINYL